MKYYKAGAFTISRMLQNEKYKGALLMQKTFTDNYLTRHQVRNTGQLAQYYIQNHHPAIISSEEWDAVQQEIARRSEFRRNHGLRGMYGNGNSPFYAKVFCDSCSVKLQRIYRKGVPKPYWQCPGCGIRIDDEELRSRFCDAFNQLVHTRQERAQRWFEAAATGSALEKVRADRKSVV